MGMVVDRKYMCCHGCRPENETSWQTKSLTIGCKHLRALRIFDELSVSNDASMTVAVSCAIHVRRTVTCSMQSEVLRSRAHDNIFDDPMPCWSECSRLWFSCAETSLLNCHFQSMPCEPLQCRAQKISSTIGCKQFRLRWNDWSDCARQFNPRKNIKRQNIDMHMFTSLENYGLRLATKTMTWTI